MTANLTHPTEPPMERLETIGCCLSAVVDLLGPEPDLHAVKRDHLALLLGFLESEYRRCLDDLRRTAART